MKSKNKERVYILGGGVTGLAAGIASGVKVFEKTASPGGICSSYYVRKGSKKRLPEPPKNAEAYRFEIGGGHWIFGCDGETAKFLSRFCSFKKYSRRSSVFFSRNKIRLPYPLQEHAELLGKPVFEKILREKKRGFHRKIRTMADWLEASFGKTLCKLFFFPFHEKYTDGLYRKIAPQDAYKSPRLGRANQAKKKPAGYNPDYFYPSKGLGYLCAGLASGCRIGYGKKAVRIDSKKRIVWFSDGTKISYDRLVSTLPLNRMLELTGLKTGEKPAPFTSVLVLNIGAERGVSCPPDHWLYVPDTKSGFSRVGFYSNVDTGFLPLSARVKKNRTSIYVEKAFANGRKPSEAEIKRYSAEAVRELQSWGWIGKTEVVDPTWIDVAYTWSYPDSGWTKKAIDVLERRDIHPLGRYGRWHFQGIAQSIRDGLEAGRVLKGRKNA